MSLGVEVVAMPPPWRVRPGRRAVGRNSRSPQVGPGRSRHAVLILVLATLLEADAADGRNLLRCGDRGSKTNPAHVDPARKWATFDAFGPATRSRGTQNDTAPAAFDDTKRLRSRFLGRHSRT